MPFYSFKTKSQSEVLLPEYPLAIGEGIDAFNLVVTDLQKFLAILKDKGVQVLETNQLDNFQPIPAPSSEPQLQDQTGVPLLIGRV